MYHKNPSGIGEIIEFIVEFGLKIVSLIHDPDCNTTGVFFEADGVAHLIGHCFLES